MIEKIEPELIDDSCFISNRNILIPIQDKANMDINSQKISKNLIKNEKDYIKEKNKFFFTEYESLYINNLLLKNRLIEVLNEKRKLNQMIIKLENQIKSSKKPNNGNSENNNNNRNFNNKQINIELYKKKKRKRRKKSEIKSVYSCSFRHCNKKYPTKSSLNMHIKLKHQKGKSYIFDNANKK